MAQWKENVTREVITWNRGVGRRSKLGGTTDGAKLKGRKLVASREGDQAVHDAMKKPQEKNTEEGPRGDTTCYASAPDTNKRRERSGLAKSGKKREKQGGGDEISRTQAVRKGGESCVRKNGEGNYTQTLLREVLPRPAQEDMCQRRGEKIEMKQERGTSGAGRSRCQESHAFSAREGGTMPARTVGKRVDAEYGRGHSHCAAEGRVQTDQKMLTGGTSRLLSETKVKQQCVLSRENDPTTFAKGIGRNVANR